MAQQKTRNKYLVNLAGTLVVTLLGALILTLARISWPGIQNFLGIGTP